MNEKIHPKYYHDCKVTCGCGATYTMGSVRPELKVDICSSCHPFFTGKLKYIDTAGRIEKFKSKFSKVGYASLKKGKGAKAEGE